MGMPDIALRIHANMAVRIDGRAFTAGPVGPDGRVFTEKATGHEIPLTNANQLRMARGFRLTSEGDFQALDDNVKEALQTDWGSFKVAERTIAEQKQRYVSALDDIPVRDRHRKAAIQAVIDAVGAEHGVDVNLRPSPRMVRHWDRLWLIGGRDIRALAPFEWKKGNRRLGCPSGWSRRSTGPSTRPTRPSPRAPWPTHAGAPRRVSASAPCARGSPSPTLGRKTSSARTSSGAPSSTANSTTSLRSAAARPRPTACSRLWAPAHRATGPWPRSRPTTRCSISF